MKYTLVRSEDGYVLKGGVKNVATWDKRDGYDYVLAQCRLRLVDGDELVEKEKGAVGVSDAEDSESAEAE